MTKVVSASLPEPFKPPAFLVHLEESDVMTRQFCARLDDLISLGYMYIGVTSAGNVVQVPFEGVHLAWQLDQDTCEWPFLAYLPERRQVVLAEFPMPEGMRLDEINQRISEGQCPAAYFEFLETESVHKVRVHLLIHDKRNQKRHSVNRRSLYPST